MRALWQALHRRIHHEQKHRLGVLHNGLRQGALRRGQAEGPGCGLSRLGARAAAQPRAERWPRLSAWYDAMEAALPEYACRVRGEDESWRRVLAMQGYVLINTKQALHQVLKKFNVESALDLPNVLQPLRMPQQTPAPYREGRLCV